MTSRPHNFAVERTRSARRSPRRLCRLIAITAERGACVSAKEATACIKINRLLEAAGWRFLAAGDQSANICVDPASRSYPPTLTTLDRVWEEDTGMRRYDRS